MLVNDLLITPPEHHHIIQTECSDFIQASCGLPLYRNLPCTYNTFQKVKVRARKRSDQVTEAFNHAFHNEFHNLSARCIFAQSTPTPLADLEETFYIFPINGFKFLYSKEVQNSSHDFREVIATLTENIDGALEISADLIKYTYTKQHLAEGITSNSEIIFYGIPYFYATRVSSINNYANLIT